MTSMLRFSGFSAKTAKTALLNHLQREPTKRCFSRTWAAPSSAAAALQGSGAEDMGYNATTYSFEQPRPPRRFLSSLSPSSTSSTSSTSSFTQSSSAQIPKTSQLTSQTSQALALLSNQNDYYAILSIRARPYYVQLHDIITTQYMPSVPLGSILSFTNILEIGSKDYILRGSPHVSNDYVTVKAVCIEHPYSKIYRKQEKRRKGHRKIKEGRPHYTLLRVCEISVNTPHGNGLSV